MATGAVVQIPQANWPISLADEPREARAIQEYSEWFLIQSQPTKERNIHCRLADFGIQSYLPVVKQRRAGGRGDHCALFPSYLFGFFPSKEISDVSRLLSASVGTVGIGHIVHFGSEPATVSQQIIDEIQKRQNVKGFIDLEAELEVSEKARISGLQAGDQVSTNSGPFRGISAIFQCHRGGDRVVLLYQMLGGQRSVELPARQVVKV